MTTTPKLRTSLKRYAQVGVIRGGGALFELAFVVLAGRALGLAETGHFFVAFTLILVAIAFARAGVDYALVRDLAQTRAREAIDEIQGRVLAGLALVACVSVLCAGLVWGLSQTSAIKLTLGTQAAEVLSVLALSIPGFAVTYAGAEVFKGFERIQVSQVLYSWLLHLPSLAILIAAPPDRAVNLAWVIAIGATGVAGFVCICVLMQVWPFLSRNRVAWITPKFRSLGYLFWIRPIALTSNGLPVWILNAMASPEIAGVYAVANRLAAAISLAVVAVEASSAPQFSKEASSGLTPMALKARVRKIQMASGGLAAGLAVAVALFASQILSLMGESFQQQGYILLLILCVAYALNGFFAPIGTYALMGGYERAALITYGLILALCAVSVFAGYVTLGLLAVGVVVGMCFVLRGLILSRMIWG